MKLHAFYKMILIRLSIIQMGLFGLFALGFALQSFAEDALLPGDDVTPTVSRIQKTNKKTTVTDSTLKQPKKIINSKKKASSNKAQPGKIKKTKTLRQPKKANNPAAKKKSATTTHHKNLKTAPKVKKNQPRALSPNKKSIQNNPNIKNPKEIKPKISQAKKGKSDSKAQKKANTSPKPTHSVKLKKRPR
ncbi:MAG: hypothetical protein K2P98_01660 [Neisseriaceae bacterium]|nr:hypothetical protein [Neisseriaceae bacterium]